MATRVKDYIPVYKAALAVGRSKTFIRRLIESGELPAIRNGGSASRPFLVVDPEVLEAVILRTQRYVPAAVAGAKRRPPVRSYVAGRPLHPAAVAMLTASGGGRC